MDRLEKETRRTVQNLYPESWREKLKPYMEVIQGLRAKKGVSLLSAGQEVAKHLLDRGANPMFALAATVELIEPTPGRG